jgi:hypothetical protein
VPDLGAERLGHDRLLTWVGRVTEEGTVGRSRPAHGLRCLPTSRWWHTPAVAEAPVRASVIAAEVEAGTGPGVAAAAAAGLRLGMLVGVAEADASLAVASAVDVALGQRRPWTSADTVEFEQRFPLALRHFLALARIGGGGGASAHRVGLVGMVGRGPSRAVTLLCDGAPAPQPVNEAIGAVTAAGPLGATALSDVPTVVELVAAVGRSVGLMPSPQSPQDLLVDPDSVDLSLLRAGLRWRRDGEPPPFPARPVDLWLPGSAEVAFSWACRRHVSGPPGSVALRAPLEAAVAALVACGASRQEVEDAAGPLLAQLP